MKTKFYFLFLTILLFSSCASTTQFSKNAGTEPLNETNSAEIYVLRPSLFGTAVKMKIFCNDQLIGKIGPKSYLNWNVKEGEHIIKCKSENDETVTIKVIPGKSYYIKHQLKPGWLTNRASLELIGEKEGKEILLNLNAPKLKSSN